MHVKNHMAMWILWFLWFLCVRYSGNPLYKPLCAFLVFVVLVWFLCGRICGFWSRVVFGLVCASDPPHVVFVDRWSCPPARCRCPWSARPLIDGLCGSVVLPSMPMPTVARMSCASTCSLWSDKKICPLLHFVLCSVSSPLGATFTNGENDHG